VTAAARRAAWLGLALAGLAALAVLLAGPGTRLGWWHFSVGFRLLRWAAWAGLGGTAVSLGAAVIGGARRERRTVAVAAAGVLIGLAAFGGPWALARRATGAPPIHDITTDPDDPPAFPPDYGGPAVAAQQRRGYPDIGPAAFREPPDRVFAAVQAAARDVGWQVVSAAPAEGRLEASDTTPWFGFTDDVVVRVRPAAACTRVDVRSVSRVGRGDLGANAARVRRFLRALAGAPLTPCPR
jgi:uncharacterized protein (DUF1499 family)